MSNIKTVERDEWGVRGVKGRVLVSSRMLAERFEKRHDNIVSIIRGKIKEAQKESDENNNDSLKNFTALNFKESEYKDKTGKKNIEYQVTKDGFAFIAMGLTGAKASLAKVEYIQRYNAMEDFVTGRLEASNGYKELITSLEDNGATYWDYPNEADMINIIVLGQRAKAYRASQGISDKETRAYLTADQITSIEKLQKIDLGLVEVGMTFTQRKAHLTKYYNTKLLPKLIK